MTTVTTQDVRNADLPTIMEILQDRQARKIDLVVPGSSLSFRDGNLFLSGIDPILEDDGFTDPNGEYHLTATFLNHLAERLDIHPSYLRRLREGRKGTKATEPIDVPRLDLFDANVNGILQGRKAKILLSAIAIDGEWVGPHGETNDECILRSAVPGDPRSHTLRLFRSDESGRGIARGLFSNKYFRMEDIDGAMAMLKGIEEAGVDPSTLRISGDITETRMYIDVEAPEIAVWAPGFVGDYRSPFDAGEADKRKVNRMTPQERADLGQRLVAERGWVGGREGGNLNYGGTHNFYPAGQEPILYAGFTLRNSELGNGRWMACPKIKVLRCDNGLVQTKDAYARTHLGSKQEDGHIAWSADTQAKELEWVTAQTRDLVKLALSQDYLETRVAEITEQSSKHVEVDKAATVLEKKLRFNKEEQDGILAHFLIGGQRTAGGLLNAITSFSQTLDSADAARDMDERAMAVLTAI